MHILAVDSSQSACTVALYRNGQLLNQLIESEPGKQAEQLLMLCNDLLSAHDVDYNELNLLAGTIGPGSFTGIRIGLAALTGINIPLQLPAYGVTTLEAMAFGARDTSHGEKSLRVCIDARRDAWFVQGFRPSDRLPVAIDEPALLSSAELKALADEHVLHVSNAPEALSNLLDTARIHFTPLHPEAQHAGAYAFKAYSIKRDGVPLLPVYVRKPDATIPEHAQKL